MKIPNVIPLFGAENALVDDRYQYICYAHYLNTRDNMQQINKHLKKTNKNIIGKSIWFSWKPLRATCTNLLNDRLSKSIENSDHVIGVYLDFSKHFDTADYDSLINKLNHYGIILGPLGLILIYINDFAGIHIMPTFWQMIASVCEWN